MKGLLPLFLGIFGTFAFSWAGLTFIPNYQIGHLDPQMDEEGTDVYPAPKSGMAERGRKVYIANGCGYCHSQQVRPDYAATDIDRKWGNRRSAPRDYIFERPALLGKTRMGPDLANIGKRPPPEDATAPAPAEASPSAVAPPASAVSPAAPAAAAGSPAAVPTPAGANVSVAPVVAAAAPGASPVAAVAAPGASPPVADASLAPAEKVLAPDGTPLLYTAAWHHRHLYNPRSVARDSNMPAFRFLYEKRRIGGEVSSDALIFVAEDRDKPKEGFEIVPSYEAKCLVAYLMSLDQTHELKEVKSAVPPSPPAPGKEVK